MSTFKVPSLNQHNFNDDMVFNITIEKIMHIDEALALELRNNNLALTNRVIASIINKKRLNIST
ncbi:MAG: hypothetical protein E6638_05495 [Clostridium perfringens]|nr:hypothetical protein [Clostridium perfringens]MDU6174571.1 hypothetical protein [Clostridium perfringens]